ncbi:MAG: hypothetical protein ACK41O_08930 [Runella zeae]
MNPPHAKGFWSQLSTFSKVLILLLILGISGSVIAYMYHQQETEVITSSTATDDEIVAASENEAESMASASPIAPETKEALPTIARKDTVKLFSKETHKRIKNLVQRMAKQAEAHPQDKEKTN